jgi:hypothetical protein
VTASRPLLGRLAIAALGVLWVLGVGRGFAVLTGHEHRPGLAADAPAQWPAGSRLERGAGRATLVMLVHPGCPCSRASIEELDRLMVSAGDLMTAYVLVLKPDGFADGWERTDLWRNAAAIPGVRVERDDGGDEAHLFGAATSGQVVVYDAAGTLMFSGGITGSRGHVGDNAGRHAIAALLSDHVSTRSESPVFGCSLHDPDGGSGDAL